ncbi:unnamed protein product, partial [Amoebophrya sp. A25]
GRPAVTNVTPTSCNVQWTPILEDRESSMFGKVVDYIVRAEPQVDKFEENCRLLPERFAMRSLWNGKTQRCEPVCDFRIDNLLPGMPYRFTVIPRHKELVATGAAGGGGAGPANENSLLVLSHLKGAAGDLDAGSSQQQSQQQSSVAKGAAVARRAFGGVKEAVFGNVGGTES